MIRPVQSEDHPAVRAVVAAAFGRPDEADLVERLRADFDVLVELVAEEKDGIVGHVLFSILKIERPGYALIGAALAPVAVAPTRQRAGIGGALIRDGLEACRARGVPGVIVLGHPEYYPRFGFSADAVAEMEAPFSGPAFMGLELQPGTFIPGGRVVYADAFGL